MVCTKEMSTAIKGVYRFAQQQTLWDGARDNKPKARRFREAQEKAEREQRLLAERQARTGEVPAPTILHSTADLLRDRLREENERDLLAAARFGGGASK
jgi:hypothetical protein